MKDKEKLIMFVEDTTTKLKLIIQRGIATNTHQASIIAEAENLIIQAEKDFKKYTDDKDFIEQQIKGLRQSYMRWMNSYLVGLNMIAKKEKSTFLAQVLTNYQLLNKDGIPAKPLKNGGLAIVNSDKDLILADKGITNIRELMTNPQEGGVGRYVDYGKKIREQISILQEQYACNPASLLDSKGNKKNLRAMAEIKVRYDMISDDLKGKDVKYVVSSSHPNESERCHWWSAKLFKVDIDVASRTMHQYDEAKSSALCKPLPKSEWVDGRETYSLKTAIDCGFLSYNCQHRLIKYYKGIKPPRYDLITIEKKSNLTAYQRQLENKVRQTKMIEKVSGRSSIILRKNVFTGEMENMKASDYSKMLQDKYSQFCKKNNLVEYRWRLRITTEERGLTPNENIADKIEVVEPVIETPKLNNETPKIEYNKDELEAVESYVSGNTMYVNQLLRRNEKLNDMEKSLVKDLDTAIDKEIVTQTKLYRSVDSSVVFGNVNENDYENLEDYVVNGDDAFDKGSYSQSLLRRSKMLLNNTLNKTITDKGYLSTTTSKKIATEFQYFTGAEHPLVMELEIPNDKIHGFPVYKFFEMEDDPQKEILLERGLSMKITDISFIKEEETGIQLYVKAKIERENN